MGDWLSYNPADFLAFTPEIYYRLFALYNRDIWPLQIPALILGIAIPVFIIKQPSWSGWAIGVILAVAWTWVAWAYHLQRYANINWAADYFALAFFIQALLLIWSGVIRDSLSLRIMPTLKNHIGLGLFGFALIIYPFLAPLSGRPWQQAELFAIAPEPTAIATLGLLLMAKNTHWHLFIIPILWCLISGILQWAMAVM